MESNNFNKYSQKLYDYCLKGELHLIIQLLKPFDHSQRSSIVNCPVIIETLNLKQTKNSEITCLLIACLKNDLEIVRYLIDNCGAEINQLTSSKDFEEWDSLTFYKTKKHDLLVPNFNYTASPLWHACRSSDSKIIKFLIQRKANVNDTNETLLNSTPLMAACCKLRLEEVKLLLDYGKANINELDINNENCLFYVVRSNSHCIDMIVEFLIQNGVEINRLNKDGKTVLELAADLELTKVVEFLIEKGARIYNTRKERISALTKSAVTGYIAMYSLLFEWAEISLEEKINSLEVVGLTSACGSVKACKLPSFHNIPYSSEYWECSLDLRNRLPEKNIRKIDGFLAEFKNYQDLEKIKQDVIEFKMQSLLIIDRMLTEYPDINEYYTLVDFNIYDFFEVNKREFLYATQLEKSARRSNYVKNFKRLCKLWIFGLSIQIEYLDVLHTSILRNIIGLICFIKLCEENNLFKANSNKFNEDNHVLGETLSKLLKICIFELISCGIMTQNNEDMINYDDLFDDRLFKPVKPIKKIKTDDSYLTNSDYLLRITVYLIRLIAQLNQDSILDNQIQMIKLKYLIGIIVSQKLNSKILNTTLFELCVENNLIKHLPIDSDFTSQDFVSINAIKLILECGADPNQNVSVNCLKKTALNSAVFSKDLKNKNQADELILLLLKFGAHLDYATQTNQTLIDKYKFKYQESILNLINPFRFISLQCLAAKSIKKYNINYENVLSKNLSEFVQKH
jgi:ankyrin repeat protein